MKHFKWEPRGKRRLHKKPNALEISACRPWLEAEIKVVKPEVVVLLGATAAQGILGSQFRVSKQRGQWVQSNIAPLVMATVHPSSILRAPDDDSRHEEMRKFVADLKKSSRAIAAAPGSLSVDLLLADLHGLVNAESSRHAGVRTGIGGHNAEGRVADFG